MLADDVSNEASKHDDLPDPGVEVRLQQEAQGIKRLSLFGTRGVRDITNNFVSASQQLPSGQLVKDEYFTLFEAVGALEIMDPKMDSGCIPPGDSFEADFDVGSGLAAAEVLWIMDELLRLEMSFHDGYPLSQNLFTSLHVMRLIHPDNKPPYPFRFDGSLPSKDPSLEEQLVHIVLRGYCVGVIRSIRLTLDLIQSHTYYEEEDFVTYLFGRDLLPKLGPQDAFQLLSDAVNCVDRSIIPKDMKIALVQRLGLREHLLLCLEEGNAEQWGELLSRIDTIDQSHSLTTALPEAFSNKVQRQLATSTPPRPMPQLSWQDACMKWEQLCHDVLAIFSLTSPEIRESPYCLQRATWAFAYRQPPPTTFARAKMQDVLTRYDSVAGDVAHFDLMLADIRDLVLAGDPLSDPASFQVEAATDTRHRASHLIEEFMQRAFGEYLNLYRMVCQNRCRMRRTFAQAVPLLDEIETVAREVDGQLNEIIMPRQARDELGNWMQLNPMTLWVRNHKLQIMEWVIQLGFETDLYLPREISDMYLTLREVARVRREQLLHIQRFIGERCRYLRTSGHGDDREQSKASEEFVKSLTLQATVVLYMSEALSDLFGLLEFHSIIDTNMKPYEATQLRYEARMKPFLSLAHDTIPSQAFFEGHKRQRSIALSATCVEIDSAIKQARSHLAQLKLVEANDAKCLGTEESWKKEIKSLETVCVAVSVAASQLRRIAEKQCKLGLDDSEDLKRLVDVTLPPPGTRYHDWWVVPQFKVKQ